MTHLVRRGAHSVWLRAIQIVLGYEGKAKLSDKQVQELFPQLVGV